MSEFARPVRLDTLGAAPRAIPIVADAAERAALARRFGLLALDRLEATVSMVRDGTTVDLAGTLRAEAVQACVATGDPVEAAIATPLALRFVPAGGPPAEEIELSADELDVVDYDGNAIDVGEAVAQSLALALDPFPRRADADARLREAGVKSEEEARAEASPFAGLAGLKGRLET